jgi:hypothetical protein
LGISLRKTNYINFSAVGVVTNKSKLVQIAPLNIVGHKTNNGSKWDIFVKKLNLRKLALSCHIMTTIADNNIIFSVVGLQDQTRGELK